MMRKSVLMVIAGGIFPFLCATAEAGWLVRIGGKDQCGEPCRDTCYQPGPWWSACSDSECDCDRECCEYCGKKRPIKKKKCCLLTCFDCAEPPRGDVAVSVAAQIQRDSFRELAEDEKSRELSEKTCDERIDTIERKLEQQEEQLTRVTVILEKIAGKL